VSGQIMFLACPAYMDRDGAVRCGLPAEVSCRFIMNSSDGPLESVMIKCPSGHCFNGPVEFLIFEKPAHEPGLPVASTARPMAADVPDRE
jgi:hypothetical protein